MSCHEEQFRQAINSDTPLFSVLIPCYNVESYVVECVESVRKQTFSSWEIVAVDDGSTDGTAAVLSELSDRTGSKMTVVCQENRGQLLSRSAAVKHAHGSYAVFLDADDVLRPDALEIVSRMISDYPGALVQFKFSRCANFGGTLHPSYPGVSELPSVVGIGTYRRWVCESSSFNNLWGKAIPISAAKTDEDYSDFSYVRNAEDLLQFASMLDAIDRIVLIADALYYYRPNPNSVTRTFQPSFYVSVKAANAKLLAHASTWDDPECLTLLRTRCLKAVRSSVAQLAGSGLTPNKIRLELAKIGSDGFFLDAWEASDDFATKSDPLLLLLRMGMHRLLSLILFAKGVLRRLR